MARIRSRPDAPPTPGFPFSPQDALEFMQRMWNPLGIAMPGFARARPRRRAARPGAACRSPIRRRCSRRSIPAEIDRKIDELRIIENWLTMSLSHDADEHQDAWSCRRRRSRRCAAAGATATMSIVLYYGSGSPYAWRVQLALEHKALPYERKVLSFSAGDTRKPEFLALNPRHRVPVIVDGDFVLYESNAIVEYLDEAYPGTRRAAVPGRRAHARARAPADRGGRQLLRQGDRSDDRRGVRARSPRSATPQKLAAGRAGGASRSSRCSRARCAATSSPARCPPPTSRCIRWSRSSTAARSSCRTSMPTALLTPELARVEGAHRGAAVFRRRRFRRTGRRAEGRRR